MRIILKHHAARLLYLILVAATFSACRKAPVKNSPGPVIPTPISVGNWKKVSGLPDGRLRVIEVAGNTLYAASDLDVVYSSTDGVNWTASTPIDRAGAITAVTVFKNKLYAGTELYGIFVSDNGGQTWSNSDSTLREASSFTVLNDTLYGGSAAIYGIEAFDEPHNQWTPFQNGLPTNYNLDVEKLITVNNTLISVQGVNGNFYIYNKGTHTWAEKYFFNSTYSPGLRVTDMIYDSDLLFAAYNNAVIVSDGTGTYWSLDTVGLKKGFNEFERRTIYAGANYYYTLNYSEAKGTWVQKKHRPLPGASWAEGEEFLPDVHGYAVREFNGMLFMSTDSGVYYEPIH